MAREQQQEVGTPKSWAEPESEPADVGEEELTAWRVATKRLRDLAIRQSLIMAEISRRSDIPQATLSLWYSGTYTGSIGNVTARVVKWLDAYEEAQAVELQLRKAPDYVATPTAQEIEKTLFIAQMLPDLVLVTTGPGMSKTTVARHYVKTRPSAHLITMRPTTSSTNAMLSEIAETLDIPERNTVRRDRAIGQKLRRNGRQTLLIVDEAQNLCDAAVDQLRHFLDQYECGIALLGNNELYTRFGKGEPREGYGQIHRRTGKRLVRLKPLDGDIEGLIAAWGVKDEAIRKLLRAIGRKPGALGQISKTMQLAGVLAALDQKPVDSSHVKAAWENRGGEDFR